MAAWRKLVFAREDLWCPVIACINKGYADFSKGILVGSEGSSNDINTVIKLGDIVELNGFPSDTYLVYRLVDYPVEQVQYIYVLNISSQNSDKKESMFCVKPYAIKEIFANVQDFISTSLLKMLDKINDGKKIIKVIQVWKHLTPVEREKIINNCVFEKISTSPLKRDVNIGETIQLCKNLYYPEKIITLSLLNSSEKQSQLLSECAKRAYSSRTFNSSALPVVTASPSLPGNTRRFKVFNNDMYGPKRYTAAAITGLSGDAQGIVSLGDVVYVREENEEEEERRTSEKEENSTGKKKWEIGGSFTRGTVYRITGSGLSILEHAGSEPGSGAELSVVKGITPDSIVKVVKRDAFFSGEGKGTEPEQERAKKFLCEEKEDSDLYRWTFEGNALSFREKRELFSRLKKATAKKLEGRRRRKGESPKKTAVRRGEEDALAACKPVGLRLSRTLGRNKRFVPLMLENGERRPITRPVDLTSEIFYEIDTLLGRISTEEAMEDDLCELVSESEAENESACAGANASRSGSKDSNGVAEGVDTGGNKVTNKNSNRNEVDNEYEYENKKSEDYKDADRMMDDGEERNSNDVNNDNDVEIVEDYFGYNNDINEMVDNIIN